MTEPNVQLLGRRAALRLLAGSAAALAVVATLGPRTAGATRVWCRTDPTFRVDGVVGNVYVSGLLDLAYDTTGPIELVFTAPTGCEVELLAVDPGFGFGYAVDVASSSALKNDGKRIGLLVDVRVPATTSDLPILVEFVPDGSVRVADKKTGGTNRAVRVKTELERPAILKTR